MKKLYLKKVIIPASLVLMFCLGSVVIYNNNIKTDKTYYVSPRASDNIKGFNIKKPDIKFDLPYIGSVKSKNTEEIESSNWFIGCETMDRDFTDYEQYKEYISPLGIKTLRMQGGWAKTEKTKGVYDWAWMDKTIDDAVSRGFKPWMQTGYGNSIYAGGGGENLGAGMPLSKEGLEGYGNWVKAMVTRYKDKIKDWEVWNEPNFADNVVNTPEVTADFNIFTAEIIKDIQPEARITALAIGHIDVDYIERFFKLLKDKNKIELFDNVTYHDYSYNPDENYDHVYKMRQIVDKYAPGMTMRQGENGAPSVGNAGGALWDNKWTELTQAKWDVRRMLGNLGNDVECSMFGIIEMQYAGQGPINKKNTKGIIESTPDNKAVRPKIAYYAIQNVTSIFDDKLEKIDNVKLIRNIDAAGSDTKYAITTDRSVSVYGYRNKESKKQLFTIWMDDAIPSDVYKMKPQQVTIANGNFENPVLVDVITGGIYEIPSDKWSKKGDTYTFNDIPVYDSPILIADKSLINIK
ncbi:hypothetical protein [Clostridium vincentii]|uniref:Xylan 1,4-beta-xylosidase n=1 Tax=Clostridium vincentii TaxID=52704 RepID=A0A2T0BGH0_9CLOT|nr:hypothetical protein [Clostridium vincentii]PRR83000.1 hypothetical protein CLVI_12490 [Clostridium vincentii]